MTASDSPSAPAPPPTAAAAPSGRSGRSGPAPAPGWTVAAEPVGSPDAVALWRAYYTEVSDRWYLLHEGRRTDPAELEREIAAGAAGGLLPPDGVLFVARLHGEPAGTAGVRRAGPRAAELTRVFLREGMRGRGGAALLVGAAEDAARSMGADRILLDTRSDLVEARTLYARLGYRETARHNDSPYAEHWFTKHLA